MDEFVGGCRQGGAGRPVQIHVVQARHGIPAGGDVVLVRKTGIFRPMKGHHRKHLVGEVPGGHGADGDTTLVRRDHFGQG